MEAIGEGAYLKSEMKEKALSVSYEAGKKESFDSISVDGILKDIIHTIKMESDGESGKDITDIEIDMETRILQKRLKEELNISVEL
ncbi:MAG: hypothetical protein LBF15_06855 [Candidatus Peribacteria bacterium]|jgi:hypothetical protein|nr:hypothetical protein [Candidatus Peribacteria bacterium]